MGAREQVLRDFLGFLQRLQAPGPDSWAAPTGEAREARALTPREGCVQGPRLHRTSFLQPAENRPWSESWLSSVGGVQRERSWQQRGRKDPSPSCPYSGGWRRHHTAASWGLSVASLLHGDGMVLGLREGRRRTWSPPLPALYHMPRELWAGRRFLQSIWLLPCDWQVGAQASLPFP